MDISEVKSLYTKKAFLYHSFFIDFLGFGRRLKRFFLKSNYLHPNAKILDAGCGGGTVTRMLYEIAHEKEYQNITFHGFDVTPAMLNIFSGWIENKKASNINIVQADVLSLKNLPPNWNQYDLIVSSGMLEYLPKNQIGHALNNLKQLMRSGGTLLVFITRRNIITKLLVELWWKANIYDQKEIEQIFHGTGFSEIRFVDFNKRWLDSTIVIEFKNM